MSIHNSSFEDDFRRKVCEEVVVLSQGLDRYIVQTPISFGDGDTLPIVLKRNGNDNWVLTDEGHTFLQLTYELDERDLKERNRREIIDRNLSAFGVQNVNGELILRIPNQGYGDALYSFIQALLKIDDIRYLSRDRVRSTFMSDFRTLMSALSTSDRITYDWHDSEHDPKANYPVDCRIIAEDSPLFIFALSTDERAAVAALSLLRFETWDLKFRGIGVYEDEESLSSRTIARFGDAAHKTFSSVAAASEGMPKFFPELRAAKT